MINQVKQFAFTHLERFCFLHFVTLQSQITKNKQKKNLKKSNLLQSPAYFKVEENNRLF